MSRTRPSSLPTTVLYPCYPAPTSTVLANTSYNYFARTPRKTSSSAVKNACLLVSYVAMDVLLLLSARVAGMCLSSRCLAMGIHVTIFVTCLRSRFLKMWCKCLRVTCRLRYRLSNARYIKTCKLFILFCNSDCMASSDKGKTVSVLN
jgi:hypothetical protein